MASSNDNLTPRPEHRFTFGLWTVGNPGRDPFGGPTREPVDPVESVKKLGELGAWGISLHDDDLIPWGTSAPERDRIDRLARRPAERIATGVAHRPQTEREPVLRTRGQVVVGGRHGPHPFSDGTAKGAPPASALPPVFSVRYFFVTVICTWAVAVAPPVSVAVTFAVYVPAFVYLWVAVRPVTGLLPSPKSYR